MAMLVKIKPEISFFLEKIEEKYGGGDLTRTLKS